MSFGAPNKICGRHPGSQKFTQWARSRPRVQYVKVSSIGKMTGNYVEVGVLSNPCRRMHPFPASRTKPQLGLPAVTFTTQDTPTSS